MNIKNLSNVHKSPQSNATLNRLDALPWDSRHFGLSMGRIQAADIAIDTVQGLLAQAQDQGLDLVEAFCPLQDEDSILALEEAGFRYGAVKVYLSRPLGIGQPQFLAPELCLEQAGPKDIPALLTNFGGLFHGDSRYRNYQGLDLDRVRALYEVWIKKAVYGRFDDVCWLLRVHGDVAGLCSLRWSGDTARIGLFAVAPAQARQGLGLLFMEHMIDRLRQGPVRIISTATQGRNLAALRFYERAGFLVDALEMCLYQRLA